MTMQELNHHLELVQRLENERELLASLEAEAVPRVQRLDGMPRAGGVSDPVSYLAVEIADMKSAIALSEAEVERSAAAVSEYIGTIEDSQTRLIFRLRFIHGMIWKEVAAVIGGGNSERAVKLRCYRYLRASME